MALLLSACSAHSYMGVPLAGGAAAPELQALASRAQADDKHAQLELGLRFKEGRGVTRNVDSARELFLRVLDQPRNQNSYIPVNGSAVTERTSIGRASFWPVKFSDISREDPERIQAILLLCDLPGDEAHDPRCDAGNVELLKELVEIEANFKDCRLRTNLGSAGSNPRNFIFNAIDDERRVETRACLFAVGPKELSSSQADLVWTIWWAVRQIDDCHEQAVCEVEEVWGRLLDVAAKPVDDSLMFVAAEAATTYFVWPLQVGTDWWPLACRSFRSGKVEPTIAEKQICATIDKLGSRRVG